MADSAVGPSYAASTMGESLALDDWYAQLAPLDEAQRLSVSRISAWISRDSEDAEESMTAAAAAEAPEAHASATASNLTAWYASMAIRREDAYAAAHNQHLVALRSQRSDVDELLKLVDTTAMHMAELRAGLDFVQESSDALIAQAGNLLDEQTKLEHLSEQIHLRLQYFSVLTPATALMSSPSAEVIETPAFGDMVQRLNLALRFMRSHPHYADASLYQMRIVHCLTRAMSLVRMRFARVGADTADAALARATEAHSVQDFSLSRPLYAALYGSFESFITRFRPHMAELERLASEETPTAAALVAVSSNEYTEILGDCRAIWGQWRASLLNECYRQSLEGDAELDAKLANAVACGQDLAVRDVDLYTRIFECPAQDARPWTGPLMHLLHALGERLRTLLQQRIDTHATLDRLASLYETLTSRANGSLADAWTQPAQKELSTRLIKAVQGELRKLAQVNADAWEEAVSNREQPQNGEDQVEAMVPFATPEGPIFAPVRRAYELLSVLHNHVPTTAFAELSLKIIEAAETATTHTAAQFHGKQVGSDAADVWLFQLRQLMYLRTLLSSVAAAAPAAPATEEDVTRGEAGFVADALHSLWSATSYFTSTARTDVREAIDDMTVQMDATVQQAAVQTSEFLAGSLALPLKIYLRQGAEPGRAAAAYETFQQSLQVNLGESATKVREFLPDASATDMLTTVIVCIERDVTNNRHAQCKPLNRLREKQNLIRCQRQTSYTISSCRTCL